MSNQWSFYHRDTGLLIDRTFSVDTVDEAKRLIALALNTPADHAPIEGHHDHLSLKVDLDQVKPLRDAHVTTHTARVSEMRDRHLAGSPVPGMEFRDPPLPQFVAPPHVVMDHKPPQPSSVHEWDTVTKRWVLTAAEVAKLTAARVAAVRRIELMTEQHGWVRRLALDPESKTARAALESIDDELEKLP